MATKKYCYLLIIRKERAKCVEGKKEEVKEIIAGINNIENC